MPKKSTVRKARSDKRAGKSAATQAGNFVREEIDEIRAGKHGAKNAKQAVAIGLSKARRAGIAVGKNPNAKKKKAQASPRKRRPSSEQSAKRSKAATEALKKQPRRAASHRALSRQAKAGAKSRRAPSGR